MLALTDEALTQLKQKHPTPQQGKLSSLLFGPSDDQFPESVGTRRLMVRWLGKLFSEQRVQETSLVLTQMVSDESSPESPLNSHLQDNVRQ